MQPKSQSTKNTPKASAGDKTSLDCEARFSLKLKKVKVEPKLRFLLLAYVLLAAFFCENHLLLALREAFFLLFGQ